MKYAQIFAIGTILAMLSLLFGGGCSTIGNGRLDIDAGAVIGAAVDAASGDYGDALRAVNKILVAKRKQTTDLDKVMAEAGFQPELKVFLDGDLITDYSRFSSRTGYYKEQKGKDAILVVLPPDTGAIVTSAEFNAAAQKLADALEKADK